MKIVKLIKTKLWIFWINNMKQIIVNLNQNFQFAMKWMSNLNKLLVLKEQFMFNYKIYILAMEKVKKNKLYLI